MDDSHHSTRETGNRMREYNAANPLAGNALFTALSAQLNQLLTELDDIAAEEAASAGAAREGTSLRDFARAELEEDLQSIARTARAIAETTPGFADNFRLPPQMNDGELVTAALGFATRAEPHAAEFIGYGLAADFIDDLRADAAVMQAKIANQSQRVADRKAAGVRLDEKCEQIMVVRRRLDALFRNVHRDDPGMLSLWTSAKHITRRRRSGGATPSGPGAGTPPPPTPNA
jgi:hypothetical protein